MNETHAPNESRTRQSTVHARPNRKGGAVAVVLSTEDLAALGVTANPGDTIAYRVDDGDLHVDTVGGSDE